MEKHNNTGTVDSCRSEDLPSIARLHRTVYPASGSGVSEALLSYYKTLLFDNPWCDEEIPSLVFRSEGDTIEGLLGILTYRMKYGGRSIRMAVPHSFMVAPECRSSMVAIQLIRTFFDGPQDLVMGDGANDPSRKLMEAMGAGTSHVYSMHWLCLLRPFSYMVRALSDRRGAGLLASAVKPVGYLMDGLLRRVRVNPSRSRPERNYSATELDGESLYACIAEFAKGSELHVDYSLEEVLWLWSYLKDNTARGESRGFALQNEKGQRMGAFLYYLRAKKYMELLFLGARDECKQAVFGHLVRHARQCGAVSVESRMIPEFLQCVSDYDCLIKHRRWVITQARDSALAELLNRGDAQLSPMDGEMWVHSLSDKLRS